MTKKPSRKTIRFDEELWDAIEAIADRVPEERGPGRDGKGAAAVRYLCRIALGQLPAAPVIPVQVRNAGEWYYRLPPEIQVKVKEIGEALVLLYRTRRSRSGEVVLSEDTVRNTFVRAGSSGKKTVPPRTRKSPR